MLRTFIDIPLSEQARIAAVIDGINVEECFGVKVRQLSPLNGAKTTAHLPPPAQVPGEAISTSSFCGSIRRNPSRSKVRLLGTVHVQAFSCTSTASAYRWILCAYVMVSATYIKSHFKLLAKGHPSFFPMLFTRELSSETRVL